MLIEAKLAARYFFSGKSRLVRFTSIVAVAGIAAGLAGFIVAQAIAEGFATGISKGLLTANGHITVRPDGLVSASPGIVKRRIESTAGVVSVIATTFEPAAVYLGGPQHYVLIRVVPDSSPGFPAAGQSTDSGIPVLLGSRLIEWTPDREPPPSDLFYSKSEGGLGTHKVRIAGVRETGIYEYDSTWIYIRESDFVRMKGLESFDPGAYEVRVNNPFTSAEVSTRLGETLGPDFDVTDWQEANRPLFAALALERQVALWVIGLIVLLAVMNITTTLSLLVKERLPDIAVLRTLGADTRMLSAVFLFEGWIIALAGIVLGVAAGSLASAIINRFRLISLPPEVYSLNTVTLEQDLLSTAAAAFVTFLLATAAMAVPVARASRVKPLDILRLR